MKDSGECNERIKRNIYKFSGEKGENVFQSDMLRYR